VDFSARKLTRTQAIRIFAIAVTIAAALLCRSLANADCDASGGPDRWSLEVQDGVSWLMTPCGERFFSVGINGIDQSLGASPIESIATKPGRGFGNAPSWTERTLGQVQEWGFNTAGSFSSHDLPLPTIPELDLGWKSHFLWGDPFDPAMVEKMRGAARIAVSVYKGSGKRIGYFSDNEVGWWNGELFRFYLAQPASNYTKRKLVALIREYYREDWRGFTRDFVLPATIADFGKLLDSRDAHVRMRSGRAGIGVIRRWTSLVTGRYYQLVHDALREADPNALIFGDRLPPYYDQDAVRAMAPYLDAIATNYNVDSADGWIGHFYFDALQRLTGNKPILISEWYFSANENRSGNLNNGHLMTVQSQDQRARGAASAARYFARFPNIVGIHWFQYYDEPTGGRSLDGENYDFGLVDTSGEPYAELVSSLGAVNRSLSDIHRAGSTSQALGDTDDIEIPQADADANETDPTQWFKEPALVKGLQASARDAVFGDFFLAWSAQGLHLATVSMDYYDPVLLADGARFPSEDAFRIDLGVDAGAGPREFAVLVFPLGNTPRTMNCPLRVEVCERTPDGCVPLPSAVATDLGSDVTRIREAIILPWSALGIAGPPRDGNLRVQLGATSFYRSRWMSLTGAPPAQALDDQSSWRIARLLSTPTEDPNLIPINFRDTDEPQYRVTGRICCSK
jgi:hypothetical protein